MAILTASCTSAASRNRLLFRARHVLGFTDPYIAHVQDDQSAPEINRAVSLALAGGVVSLAQCEDLQAVDIIISDSDNRYLLIEASITADFSDVDRAGRRAEILKLITGGEVTPGHRHRRPYTSSGIPGRQYGGYPLYHSLHLT